MLGGGGIALLEFQRGTKWADVVTLRLPDVGVQGAPCFNAMTWQRGCYHRADPGAVADPADGARSIVPVTVAGYRMSAKK